MKNLFIPLCIFFAACSSHYSSEIEDVLKQAGNNRSELEQVLKHYAQSPADSLKLKASEFLIMNMPGKYSKYYDAPWNDVATVNLRWTSSSYKQTVLDTYKLDKPIIKEDVKYITAEYLINNIDLAFKVWREQPWGKHISFDTFCEEILPYRVDSEPLENWREKALASFADPYNDLRKDSTITAVEACTKINNLLPRFRTDKDFSAMNYSQLMATTRGTCAEMGALAVFVMRALGIPVTREYTPQWPNRNIGHSWNAVCDSGGRHTSFLGCESNPEIAHEGLTSKTAKVYRQTFARQQHPLSENRPPELWNVCFTDVSAEYESHTDVNIPVRFPAPKPSAPVYLSLLGHFRWNIISWGYANQQTIQFPAIGTKIIYMPVYYQNGNQLPANYPFMPDEEGNILFFKPDTTHYQTLTLSEVSPSLQRWFWRMKGAAFEGSNQSDFSDAKILHIIKDIPGDRFETAKINNPGDFRYFRYYTAKNIDAYCDVSEIKVYGKDGKQLRGKPIGTPGAWFTHPETTFEKAFDGNVRTFFSSNNHDSWTGLDLGEPQQITEIHYLSRLDDHNGIYEGHTYEMFYWNGSDWQSLGKKEATIQPLQYQVPSNALLYLNNVTTNNMGRVFLAQDGEQKWM